MKTIKFAAVAVMALALVAAPANAQSRKDKKAAQKANWEMEQQMQREEAQLRHKMKMDSLANVQKRAEEEEEARKAAVERYEAERRAEEAEAKARQKKAEELAAMQEVDIADEPCTEVGSADAYVRARGIGESLQQQMARTKAQANAVREMGAKIGSSVQALLKQYSSEDAISVLTDDNAAEGMSFEERTQSMIKQKVDQNLSYSTFCEKTRTYMKNNKKVYKCYITIQAGKDELLKPVYDGLQSEATTKLNIDYNKFSEEFDKEFNKE